MSNQESAFIISRLWPPESESLEGPMWPRWWRPLKKWESKGASNSWRPPCMAEWVVRRRRRVRKSKVDPYHARIWRLLWELLLLLRSWFWGRITRMLSSFSQYLVQVRRGHLTLCFAKSEREREKKAFLKAVERLGLLLVVLFHPGQAIIFGGEPTQDELFLFYRKFLRDFYIQVIVFSFRSRIKISEYNI